LAGAHPGVGHLFAAAAVQLQPGVSGHRGTELCPRSSTAGRARSVPRCRVGRSRGRTADMERRLSALLVVAAWEGWTRCWRACWLASSPPASAAARDGAAP